MTLLPFHRRPAPPPTVLPTPPLLPVTDQQITRAVAWLTGVNDDLRPAFTAKLLSDAATRWRTYDGPLSELAAVEYAAITAAARRLNREVAA